MLKIKMKILNSQRGQTIIELLIATLVVGTVVTGVAVALSYNIQRNAEVRFREAATNMSQETLEVLRREREKTSWGNFHNQFSSGQTYCVNQSLSSLEAMTTNNLGECGSDQTYPHAKTEYQRELEVTKADQDTIEFTVTISWHAGTADEISISTTHRMKNRLN